MARRGRFSPDISREQFFRMSYAKPCDKLTPDDLKKFPVWTLDLANEGVPGRDETWMVPVRQIPVASLDGCACMANASLACGKRVVATLWGIDLKDLRRTEQFVTISLWLDGKWWALSERSFPSDSGGLESHLPSDLASKLGLDISAVFPISYDISQFASGPEVIIRGKILTERREKLTTSQRIALALGRGKDR